MVEASNGRLVIPALQARMGDWTYYVTFCRLSEIAARVSMTEEIHQSKALNDLIQRRMSNRAIEIKEYLLTQEQRFFNALVLGVYGGAPQWYELEIRGNDLFDADELPLYLEGALGFLVLEGTEKLFAIDGQHRVMGIREAVQARDDLGAEEVSSIFVAHGNDPLGMARTRRLFTTLNRYAKPVSKLDIIALDEDDAVAIVTRKLLDEHPLFIDRTSLAQGKNIAVTDRHNFTTVVALYDALNVFLRRSHRGWSTFKKKRPDEETINGMYEEAVRLWEAMIKYFEPLRELCDSKPSDELAAKYRNRDGGHLLFRPIGVLIVVKVIRYLMDSGVSLYEAVQRTSRVPMLLAQEPWVGLLWDPVNHRMITAPVNQKAGERLLMYAAGGDLSSAGITIENLRQELAGLLNEPIDKVPLRPYT